GAKEILQKGGPETVRAVVNVLLRGDRVLNRAAAAHALNLTQGKSVVLALEKAVANKREHPKVRGQAAESLACTHRAKSHDILLANLNDPSKEVRFWCAYSLAEMADEDALVPLKRLAEQDHRVVKGLWSVSKDAKWAIRAIRKACKRRRKPCLFCSKMRTNCPYRTSHA